MRCFATLTIEASSLEDVFAFERWNEFVLMNFYKILRTDLASSDIANREQTRTETLQEWWWRRRNGRPG